MTNEKRPLCFLFVLFYAIISYLCFYLLDEYLGESTGINGKQLNRYLTIEHKKLKNISIFLHFENKILTLQTIYILVFMMSLFPNIIRNVTKHTTFLFVRTKFDCISVVLF